MTTPATLQPYTAQEYPEVLIQTGTLVALISAVAFSILFILGGEPSFHTLIHSQAFLPLAGVGAGFILFIIGMVTNSNEKRKVATKEAEIKHHEIMEQAYAERKELYKVDLQGSLIVDGFTSPLLNDSPELEQIRKNVVMVLDSLENVLFYAVMSHADVLDIDPDPQVSSRIKKAMESAKYLLNTCCSDSKILIADFLSQFGSSRLPLDTAVRHLIAAQNSRNPQLLARAKEEYEATLSIHEMKDVAKYFKSNKSAEEKLRGLPDLLQNHFALNENFKKLGLEIWIKIVAEELSDTALDLCKNYRYSEKTFGSFLQDIFYAQAESISDKVLQEWANRQIKLALESTDGNPSWAQNTGIFVFKILENTIRIFEKLFKAEDRSALLPDLDELLLLSESSQFIMTDLQKEVLKIQIQLNADKKPNTRFALVLREENEDLTYIEKACSKIEHSKRNQAEAFQKTIPQNLIEKTQKEGLVIRPLPLELPHHPFRKLIEITSYTQEGNRFTKWIAKKGANLFEGRIRKTIDEMVRPGLYDLLPKLDDKGMGHVENFYVTILDLLYPIAKDGAILDTKYRKPFEDVIVSAGTPLADKIADILSRGLADWKDLRGLQDPLENAAKAFEGHIKAGIQ